MSPVPEGVKNLIFDFGGIIINIDFTRTFNAFSTLGIKDVNNVWQQIVTSGLLNEFERGLHCPDDFRKKMNVIAGLKISDEVFDNAWNSMLLDIPVKRVRLIEHLKKKYKVYLLSNTNEIHYKNYSALLKGYGYNKLDDLFDGAWFSFRMGKLKPEVDIFEEVLKKENLIPSETMFIDDLQANVNGAERTGIKGLCIDPGTLCDFFSDFTE
jgi:glucose-1-phosphatase